MQVQGRLSSDSDGSIRWPQVFSLVGVDAAALLSWMAYNEYQSSLLDRFGYAVYGGAFMVLQVLVLVITPPLAGHLTDRLLARGAARFVVVNLGISLAAMIFMATALALAVPVTGWLARLFPLLVVLWMISMNIFHAPALSMLELCAPPRRLTGVAAAFVVFAGLLNALEPSISVLIDALGAPLTFAAGGVCVLAAGAGFFHLSRDLPHVSDAVGAPGVVSSRFITVLLLGAALGFGEALMNDLLPHWINRMGDLLPGVDPAWQSSALYGIAALAAWPLGRLGDRVTPGRLAGWGGLAGLLLGVTAWSGPAPWSTLALGLFPAAYAALAVTALPVVFRCLVPEYKTLGVGLLFSGVELAGGLVRLVLSL